MTRAPVVDDQRKMRRVLQILLEEIGVETVPADRAEAALEHFGGEKFDVVLTDLKMAGMSGIDLLAQIRALDADVPVVVLTAHGSVETAVLITGETGTGKELVARAIHNLSPRRVCSESANARCGTS